LEEFVISDELTQFRFADDHAAWWIPNEYDTYEMLYTKSPLSQIGVSEIDTGHTHSTAMKSVGGAKACRF